MPVQPPFDFWHFLTMLIISIVSGTISIFRRILQGQEASWIWAIAEFLSAILMGYLVYDAYPIFQKYLPEWITLPIMVAIAAHSGGRMLQFSESKFYKHYSTMFDRRNH